MSFKYVPFKLPKVNGEGTGQSLTPEYRVYIVEGQKVPWLCLWQDSPEDWTNILIMPLRGKSCRLHLAYCKSQSRWRGGSDYDKAKYEGGVLDFLEGEIETPGQSVSPKPSSLSQSVLPKPKAVSLECASKKYPDYSARITDAFAKYEKDIPTGQPVYWDPGMRSGIIEQLPNDADWDEPLAEWRASVLRVEFPHWNLEDPVKYHYFKQAEDWMK